MTYDRLVFFRSSQNVFVVVANDRWIFIWINMIDLFTVNISMSSKKYVKLIDIIWWQYFQFFFFWWTWLEWIKLSTWKFSQVKKSLSLLQIVFFSLQMDHEKCSDKYTPQENNKNQTHTQSNWRTKEKQKTMQEAGTRFFLRKKRQRDWTMKIMVILFSFFGTVV